MSLSPELEVEYANATVPFIDGAIGVAESRLKSWRYFLEINSVCSLRCPTCTKGNQKSVHGLKYEHQTGIMDMDLMERILDKIKAENPEAIVFCYGNSEPFLHPYLPECIASIKRRGLHPEMSTNLNSLQRVQETLEAGPELIIISLSGFTQEIYERGHAGGNIEKVKENMKIIGEANAALPADKRVKILVNYHAYNDNEHELPLMKEYSSSLGIGFFTSYARAISMENSIRFCQSRDPEATEFEVQEGKPDWNKVLPPVTPTYEAAMTRLKIPPTNAREMYKDYPLHAMCPVGAGGIFTFIRHDGKTEMCACVADRRITVGDYLDTTPEEMIQQRTGHAICKQCIKYRLNLYFMIADREMWGEP